MRSGRSSGPAGPRDRVRRRQVPADGRLRAADRRPDRRRRPGTPGAHLAEGTTVMHEGFVNYNAGTLGTSMVEGRISAGVVVGKDSDVGGGASIMGTLSGGGQQVISIGERCLLGANSGLGISLGDDCIVEAGLYLTAATKVTMPDGQVVKARSLSGESGLLFIRNSVTGAIEARRREGSGVELNAALHAELSAPFAIWNCTDPRLPRRRTGDRDRARPRLVLVAAESRTHRSGSGSAAVRGHGQRPVGGARPGPGPLRLDHRRPVGQAWPAAAGRVDRDGDRLPGDRDPQPGLRRPGFGRTVPAASRPRAGAPRSS